MSVVKPVRRLAAQFAGGYHDVVQVDSDTLDAVIRPVHVACEYIERVGKGEIPDKITDNYNGDFNKVKGNISGCIDGLGGLVEANTVFQRTVVNAYDTGVEDTYSGIYAKIAEATNGVRLRVLNAVRVLKLVNDGDMRALPELQSVGEGRGKRSDKDDLVPAFISSMTTLTDLVTDVRMLSRAAVEVKLETRADSSRYAGEYHIVVEGVNNTLDAIVQPINEAAAAQALVAERDLTARLGGN